MRIAVVSDVHGNEWAWQAVRMDLSSMGAERILCLGDVVGYGPRPAETLESVHEHADHILLGNHDAALAGLMSDETFSDDAREVLQWSRGLLASAATTHVASWPLSIKGPGFRAVHGDFAAPGCFNYLFEPDEAAPSWRAVNEPLLFAGHTHVPALFLLGESGTPRRAPVQDFIVEPGRRYLVNPGSVGQPRDGDPRAGYVMYDTADQAIYFRRVPFDLDAYAAAVEKAGLPATSKWFLQHDPRRDRRPVREFVSFRPPPAESEGLRKAVQVEDVSVLRASARRWKAIAAAVSILLLAAGIAAALLWNRSPDQMDVTEAIWTPLRHATDLPAGQNLLPPVPAEQIAGAPMAGWGTYRTHPTQQTVTTVRATVAAAGESPWEFRLQSSAAEGELSLESAPIAVEPGTRLRVRLAVGASAETPRVALVVVAEDAEGKAIRNLVNKEAAEQVQRGRRSVQETFDMSKRGARVRIRAVLRGAGTAEGVGLTLERVPAKKKDD